MSVQGDIAKAAQGELPETWRALAEIATGYGDPFLERRLNSVMTQIFGRVLTVEEQGGLDHRVLDYAGKTFALALINPGIDYWSKQKMMLSAGERETSTYANRASELKELRKYLLEETRNMLPEVNVLIPDMRVVSRAVPMVREPQNQHTPSPYDFEEPYGPPPETLA